MPDQAGDESQGWVDAHGLLKLIPSLVTATSEGWALRGQKFTSPWGLLQLLTQGKQIQLTTQLDFPLQ